MACAYPLLLDVTQRVVVIVGAGAVAARKSAGLLEAGATRIRVVAPERGAALPDHPAIAFVASRYVPGHLDGAALVFAATDDPKVNDAVVRDARLRGIPVCRADSDDELPGDFVTPAKLSRGPMVVTVSTGSAALAARVRDEIAGALDEKWIDLARAMETLRPEILATVDSPDARRRVFRALADDEAVNRLREGGVDALRAWIREMVGKF